MPGGRMYHQLPVVIDPTSKASSSMVPQEVRVGSPSPRKLRVVSVRIAIATVSVVLANTIGITFGRTCLVIWWRRPAPIAWARSTYGRSLIDSVWLRISSAVPGHEVTPMTSTMLNRPRPSTVDSTIASGRKGITRNHSVTRKVIAPMTATEVARHQAHQGADHHRDQGRQQADEQGHPCAPDQQGQHGAAVLVGAEPVLRGRRAEHRAGRLRSRRGRSCRPAAVRPGPRPRRQCRMPRPIMPLRWARNCFQPRLHDAVRRCRASWRVERPGDTDSALMSALSGRASRRPGWRPGWRG